MKAGQQHVLFVQDAACPPLCTLAPFRPDRSYPVPYPAIRGDRDGTRRGGGRMEGGAERVLECVKGQGIKSRPVVKLNTR